MLSIDNPHFKIVFIVLVYVKVSIYFHIDKNNRTI